MSFASVFQHLKYKFGELPHNNTRDLVEGQIIGINLQIEENIDFILEDVLTFRLRNTPYGDYGSSETHHMEIFYIGTRNNKLTIQGMFQHLETLHI